jgi:hypothetical protein
VRVRARIRDVGRVPAPRARVGRVEGRESVARAADGRLARERRQLGRRARAAAHGARLVLAAALTGAGARARERAVAYNRAVIGALGRGGTGGARGLCGDGFGELLGRDARDDNLEVRQVGFGRETAE